MNKPDSEGRISLATISFQKGQICSLHAAAKLYSVTYTTISRRFNGTASRATIRANSQKLTQTEEESLFQWIFSIDLRGAAPRPSTVREMANILLAKRGSTPSLPVGKNWASNSINRYDELCTRFSRHYNYQRAQNEDPKSLREWYNTVQRVIDENGIQPDDIYNFNETGFVLSPHLFTQIAIDHIPSYHTNRDRFSLHVRGELSGKKIEFCNS